MVIYNMRLKVCTLNIHHHASLQHNLNLKLNNKIFTQNNSKIDEILLRAKCINKFYIFLFFSPPKALQIFPQVTSLLLCFSSLLWNFILIIIDDVKCNHLETHHLQTAWLFSVLLFNAQRNWYALMPSFHPFPSFKSSSFRFLFTWFYSSCFTFNIKISKFLACFFESFRSLFFLIEEGKMKRRIERIWKSNNGIFGFFLIDFYLTKINKLFEN